ncbi:MAG: [protein-PII] uridylyltransferase [Gammaproteobacteria bacterium]|nr:[protein-PII] uridylyltransferase [Gammaproteobacteria bacterium]
MPLHRQDIFDPRRFDVDLAGLSADRQTGSQPPAQALPLFRSALQTGRGLLKQHYLEGAPVQDILGTHAWLVDQLLKRAWDLHQHLAHGCGRIALAAVGGYGRGELYPASDVDLLILLEKRGHASAREFARTLLSFLWDIGLEVGHSVRTLRDCTRESRKDITVATNLMEARWLAGEVALFDAMRAVTGPPRIWPSSKFFAAKWQEQIERHHHFGDTAYRLEPNIKEGPGGLRDIQMIAWVTQRHFGSATLHDLVALEFLSESEYRSLSRGRQLLAQLRCGIHYLAGHREDRLLFDYQVALAAQLGYVDRPGSRAVEQFMKHYYRVVKELALLNEILLQHFQEAILSPGRKTVRAINRRFQARDDFLEVTRSNVFEKSPYAILEMFLVLQQHPDLKGVRAQTIRLLRENLHRVNNHFRQDIACRSLFMEILRQPRGITHALRRMNAYGVLAAYIPPFGRIVGQMQHDLFHAYTVDEHTLFVVRNLRRFTVPQFEHEFPLASRLIQHLVKPERLYLGGMFHDIAKGRGGDHSTLGEAEARAFCERHGLSEYDTRFVSWLVRNHLIMSWTAQRQDITDPRVVLEFAQKAGDQEHLDNLYLLTVADMRGTSPAVWNVWKDRLLSQLHAATTRVLRRGFARPIDLEERISDLKQEAMRLLAARGVDLDLVRRHWARMESDYFLRHDADALAWHAEKMSATVVADLPLVSVRFQPGAGGTEFLVFTPDRDDLFAVITGGFDRLNLSIVDARIHTTGFGFALDTFVALDHAGNAVTDPAQLVQLEAALRKQLLEPKPGRDLRSTRLPRVLRHFRIATRVSFATAPNGQQTMMEVVAQDRPGLLYQVALALQHCRARLVTAKVATYGERAEDIFYIVDRDGQAITDRKRQDCLDAGIRERLEVPGQDSDDGTRRDGEVIEI